MEERKFIHPKECSIQMTKLFLSLTFPFSHCCFHPRIIWWFKVSSSYKMMYVKGLLKLQRDILTLIIIFREKWNVTMWQLCKRFHWCFLYNAVHASLLPSPQCFTAHRPTCQTACIWAPFSCYLRSTSGIKSM
jgi:hypothetical protein